MDPGRKTSLQGSDTESGAGVGEGCKDCKGCKGYARQARRQQNADKFRACARAPSASAVPPASRIAPVRVWRTVNVHPPCRVVNTPLPEESEAVSQWRGRPRS